MRWVMQAAKTLTTTQRTRRRPIHFLITTITFGMNAMVEGRPRQLKMPRLDAYGRAWSGRLTPAERADTSQVCGSA